MDDLISRENMIGELRQLYNEARKWYDDAPQHSETEVRAESRMATLVEIILRAENMPSAQPENIRCKDCMNWDTTWESVRAKNYHYCPVIGRTCNGDWYCADAERRTDE